MHEQPGPDRQLHLWLQELNDYETRLMTFYDLSSPGTPARFTVHGG